MEDSDEIVTGQSATGDDGGRIVRGSTKNKIELVSCYYHQCGKCIN